MITVPLGVRVYLALDMRKGFDGLSLLAQEVLREIRALGYHRAKRCSTRLSPSKTPVALSLSS